MQAQHPSRPLFSVDSVRELAKQVSLCINLSVIFTRWNVLYYFAVQRSLFFGGPNFDDVVPECTVLRHMTYLSGGKRCFRNNSHYKRNICGSLGSSRMTQQNFFITKATAVVLNRGNV